MLPGISAKSASHLGRLRLPLELIDLAPLSNGLAVHGVLEPFDHGLEVRNAFLQVLETLRCGRVSPAGIGRSAGRPSARAESGHHALEQPW